MFYDIFLTIIQWKLKVLLGVLVEKITEIFFILM